MGLHVVNGGYNGGFGAEFDWGMWGQDISWVHGDVRNKGFGALHCHVGPWVVGKRGYGAVGLSHVMGSMVP